MSNWIWKIYHIDIILRPKLCQFVQFEISSSMSHKVFIFFKITHMCYWLSCDLIPAYWCGLIPAYWSIIDSYGTSFQVLMCYWFSCDLFPACWCVIDYHVTSFQQTDVLLILMLPHSSILMCYWFSCDLIPAYWFVIDSHAGLHLGICIYGHCASLLKKKGFQM
jgi:hypothetical protein